MSYRIEISFDLRKTKNISEMKKKIRDLALKNEKEICFFSYEMMGYGRTINRNHVVSTLYFTEQTNIINFIKSIKKIPGIYIESIGIDNIKFILIYASKKYLNFMDKYKAKDYLKNRADLLNEYKNIINQINTSKN